MSTWKDRQEAAQAAVKLYWVSLAEDGVEMEPRVPFVPSMDCVELEITRQFVCDTILVFERRRVGTFQMLTLASQRCRVPRCLFASATARHW